MEGLANDKSAFLLPRQHLQKPNGSIRYAGSRKQTRSLRPLLHRFRGHQHRRNRQWRPLRNKGKAKGSGSPLGESSLHAAEAL